MAMIVTVVDETSTGERGPELTLEFLTERVSVREIIRSRVYEEVTEYNARGVTGRFHGLVQPTDDERLLNGPPARPRRVDWETQFEVALTAFRRNGFLLLVDEHQCLDLDEEVDLHHDSIISFLKLVPLVGG
jgi:hypothetical protein